MPGKGKPFTKRDPRINKKGRPKKFDALRELAQQIAHEKAVAKGGQTLVVHGHSVTTTEAILRSWATSKNSRLQQQFIEIAYGKVPNITEITGKDGRPIEVDSVDRRKVLADLAARTSNHVDSGAPDLDAEADRR